MHPIESAFCAGECRPQDRAGDESGVAQLGRLNQAFHPWGRAIMHTLPPIIVTIPLLHIPPSRAKYDMNSDGQE